MISRLLSLVDPGEELSLPRKRVDSNFPLDCIGEILSFCSNSSIINNFRSTSYQVKEYIDKYPHCAVNIKFKLKKTPLTCKTFVMNLTAKVKRIKKLFNTKFPNVRVLHLVGVTFSKNYKDSLSFNDLEELDLEGCKKIDNPPFERLKKLRVLRIDNSHHFLGESKLKTTNFRYLENLEKLHFKSVKFSKFKPDDFSSLKKLRYLNLNRSRQFCSSTFQHFENLETLKVEYMYMDIDGFKHLRNIKDLVIKNVRGINSKEEVVKIMGGRVPQERFEFRMAIMKRGEMVAI